MPRYQCETCGVTQRSVKHAKACAAMLLTEFDPEKSAVINPDMVVEPLPDFPDVTISIFSKKLFDAVLGFFPQARQIAAIRSAVGANPVYQVEYKGESFAFYQSYVGEPKCIGDYEDVMAMGSRRLILLGNCGVLDRNIQDCGIIIPTRAIRDEGASYHYAPAADMIDVNRKYKEEFKEVLREYGYPYVEGITWTTDACYRETREKVRRRKEQGAICVEMECAGMQALCDFRGTEFFQFFYAGDNLDHSSWQPRSLSGDVRLDDKGKIALLAFELGLRIKKKAEPVIRRFRAEDAQGVTDLIATTMRTTNSADYPPHYIEEAISNMQPKDIIRRASWTHYYVICEGDRIIACGAIGPYWNSETESSLFNIFVHPDYQGQGLGRKIIETVEQDEYALRANRIEIPASITAVKFYQKMGYDLKPGGTYPDNEGLYRMEKYR